MSQLITPVQAVEVDEVCDACKKGRYRSQYKLISAMTTENKLVHFCTECGDRKDFENRLPYMAYRHLPAAPLDLGPQIVPCHG